MPLCDNAEFYHKSSTLKRHFEDKIIEEIGAAEKEAIAYNKAAKKNPSSGMLTPEAASYWRDVQALLKRGEVAQATGNANAEKAISLASEKLKEEFDARVPDHDKPKFKELDAQRHEETWDERWSYIEFPAPLLRSDFASAYTIACPKNHAQRTVLMALAQPPHDDALVASARASGLLLLKKLAEMRGDAQIERMKKEQKRDPALKEMIRRGKLTEDERAKEDAKAARKRAKAQSTANAANKVAENYCLEPDSDGAISDKTR